MNRWPIKPLGEVCDLVNGAPFKPSDWDGGGLPIIRIQNLNDSTKIFNYTSKKVSEKFRVRLGDTLLSWSGTPGTSFGCFRWTGPEGWLNQHIFNVHLNGNILPAFFIHQVNSKLDELIAKAHGGVGLQHITKGALSSVNMIVPPLTEQERIVKLLDEADELRKLRAQADQRTEALIPALFHEMFGDPATNSMGFRKEPLKNLIRVKSGDALPAKNMESGGQYPVYGGNGVSGYHNKFMFEKPMVVIGRVGAYCGAVCLSEPKSWVTDNALYISEFTEAFDQEYLVVTLRLANFNQYAGRAAQPLVSGSRIYPIPILIPPMSLQQEFAKRVSEIRELEVIQSSSRQRLDDLFQSMLHRAFNGDL